MADNLKLTWKKGKHNKYSTASWKTVTTYLVSNWRYGSLNVFRIFNQKCIIFDRNVYFPLSISELHIIMKESKKVSCICSDDIIHLAVATCHHKIPPILKQYLHHMKSAMWMRLQPKHAENYKQFLWGNRLQPPPEYPLNPFRVVFSVILLIIIKPINTPFSVAMIIKRHSAQSIHRDLWALSV